MKCHCYQTKIVSNKNNRFKNHYCTTVQGQLTLSMYRKSIKCCRTIKIGDKSGGNFLETTNPILFYCVMPPLSPNFDLNNKNPFIIVGYQFRGGRSEEKAIKSSFKNSFVISLAFASKKRREKFPSFVYVFLCRCVNCLFYSNNKNGNRLSINLERFFIPNDFGVFSASPTSFASKFVFIYYIFKSHFGE